MKNYGHWKVYKAAPVCHQAVFHKVLLKFSCRVELIQEVKVRKNMLGFAVLIRCIAINRKEG